MPVVGKWSKNIRPIKNTDKPKPQVSSKRRTVVRKKK